MPNRLSNKGPIPFELLTRGKALAAARAGGAAQGGVSTVMKRPAAPRHLRAEARAVWRRAARQMVAANTWRPAYAELLTLYCELRATFDQDPPAFPTTKLVTLRLLARDLGLSPGTALGPTP